MDGSEEHMLVAKLIRTLRILKFVFFGGVGQNQTKIKINIVPQLAETEGSCWYTGNNGLIPSKF